MVPNAPPLEAGAEGFVYAPVVDVGGTKGAPMGEPGSEFRRVYLGPGTNAAASPGDDQVQHDFLAARATAQAGDPWSQLDALVGSTQPSQAAPRVAGAGSPTPGPNGPQQPYQAVQGPVPDADQPLGTRLIGAASAIVPAPEDEDEGESSLSLDSLVRPAGAVAKDVAIGALETPQAVLRGLIGGVGETAGAALSVGQAIDKVLPQWLLHALPMGAALNAVGSAPGQAGLRYVAESAAEDKSEIPAPTSTTGAMVEMATQFGVGLKGGNAVAEGLRLTGRAAHILADVVAGATSMDPAAPRLSNLIDDVAPNFLTEWLKARPDQDGALFGRLKAGLEFAGLGAIFEGLKAGLGVIKRAALGTPSGFGRQSSLGRGGAGATQTAEQPRPTAAGVGPEGTGPAPEGVLPTELAQPKAPLVTITPSIRGMAEQVAEQQAGLPRQPPGEAGLPVGATEGGAETLTGHLMLSPEEVSDYMEGRNADNPVRINLLRIGSGDDIRAVLEQVARTIPAPEVRTNDAMIRAADALGLSPSDFLAGYKGTNLSDAEIIAMRFILDSSAQQLIDYGAAVYNPITNSDEARVTLLRALATHRALQLYLANAGTEASHALHAFSILSRQQPGYVQAVKQIVEQGGRNDIDQMAADLASLQNPLQVSRLVAASVRGTGRDTFLKVFYNTLLSNPRTIVKKLASDGTMVMWNLATNFAAERLGSGAVPPGDTAALAYGYVSSMKDALRMAGKGLAAGQSQFFSQFQTMDWLDKSRLSLLSNGAPQTIADDAPTQAGASYLRAALPTSWIGAADDFAKYLNYRAYLREGAYRDGVSKGLDGPDLATHVATNLDNVPNWLHQQALAQALRSTFQEPLTGVLQKIQGLVDALNVPVAHTDFQIPIGRIIVPFVKVPANIMRWSYNNTALNRLLPSRAIQSEMAAGGATRDLALARTWLGSAVALSVADLALNNTITGAGPRDPQLQRAWRAAGNEPYSIQLPGQRPVSYNMVEPMGMLTGSIADTFNIMKFAREDGRENLAASLMFGAGNAVLSKTYMQGTANLFEALNEPDRSGDRIAQSVALPFLSPQGVAAAAHAIDPWVRAHRTLMDNVESRLPIVSERLPPARTLWGDPISQRDAYLPFLPSNSFVPRFVSPWQLGPEPGAVEPIDRWIWDNRTAFPRSASNQLGISKPAEFQSFEPSPGSKVSVQVQLSPVQFDRFQELAGNGLKNPTTGLGAKDLLNGLVAGTSTDRDAQAAWNAASPAYQAVIVQRVVNRYRAAAREELMHEFPDLGITVTDGARTRAKQMQGQGATLPATAE